MDQAAKHSEDYSNFFFIFQLVKHEHCWIKIFNPAKENSLNIINNSEYSLSGFEHSVWGSWDVSTAGSCGSRKW